MWAPGGIQMEEGESRKKQSGSVLGGASKHGGKKTKGKEVSEVLGKSSVLEEDAVVRVTGEETPHLLKDFANKSDIFDDGGDEAEDGMEGQPWEPQHSRFPSELESYVLVLERLKEAGRRVVNLSEKGIISGSAPDGRRMQEVRALCNRVKKAERNLHLLLGCTEAGSPQTTEPGMEDSAKSSLEKLVIGPLPPETEVKGESVEQHMIEPTENADLIPTDTESDFGYDVDVDEWRPTIFDSNKLLLEAADAVPTNTGYGNVDEMDKDKSAEQLRMEAEEMAAEESDFARYTEIRDRRSAHDGYFGDMTTLSSTQFTHLLPGTKVYGAGFPSTLQVLSIKLTDIKGGLEWPFPVYGMVAVRDTVDHNRNLLFARDRSECQRVEKDHPYLRLTGPSRAIVFQDGVIFEIQLKLRGSTASQDRALITRMQRYQGRKGTICFKNCFCTAELCLEVIRQTVQATILGVHLKGGSWPSKYGGRVVCVAPSVSVETIHGQFTNIHDDQPGELVLVDSRCRAMPMASDGYLLLSRQVVSVEIQGILKVVLQTYSASGDIDSETQVYMAPEYFNARARTCKLSGVELEITVAWSRMVTEKDHITSHGWVLDGDAGHYDLEV